MNALIQKFPFIGKQISKSIGLIEYSSNNVKYQNLNKKWPYKDNSVDIVYSSHLFEHLSLDSAELYLKESYRCLKRNGVLRIVVPDLYKICKAYINEYENTDNKNPTEFIMWALNLHREGRYWKKIKYSLKN